jgi:hypothetical protein
VTWPPRSRDTTQEAPGTADTTPRCQGPSPSLSLPATQTGVPLDSQSAAILDAALSRMGAWLLVASDCGRLWVLS